MNSLYQQLQRQTQGQGLQQVYQPQLANQKLSIPQQQMDLKNNLLSQFLNSPDKEAFLKSMMGSNPRMQNILQLANSANLTPKQFFYQYAQKMGVNPDQFLNSFKE